MSASGDLDLRALPPRERKEHMYAAVLAELTRPAETAEAQQFVEALAVALEARETRLGTRKNRRAAGYRVRLLEALAAFVGDLLGAPQRGASGGLIFRSRRSNTFKGERVSYRQFATVLTYLRAEGLLEEFPGFGPGKGTDWGDGVISEGAKGKAARFRATPKLLSLTEDCGMLLDHADDHFPPPPVSHATPLVVLKSGSDRQPGEKKKKGVKLPLLPPGDDLDRITKEMETIRDFLEGVTITGGRHRHFKRQFELGDEPGFAWNKGGRLYSIGAQSYQQLKGEARLAMTFNGEPVAEIDIRASYLTILHAHMGAPLDPHADPYELPGQDRWAVKTWVTASLTKGEPVTMWSAEHRATYAKRRDGRDLRVDHRPSKIAAAVAIAHPLLRDLSSLPLGWADLMFIESEAVVWTMLSLIAEGVPALPVHDSLIVPRSWATRAADLLETEFSSRVGVKPTLKIEALVDGSSGWKALAEDPRVKPVRGS